MSLKHVFTALIYNLLGNYTFLLLKMISDFLGKFLFDNAINLQ